MENLKRKLWPVPSCQHTERVIIKPGFYEVYFTAIVLEMFSVKAQKRDGIFPLVLQK